MASVPVFNDEIVRATSLNRHPGRVLDQALVKPITIVRNDEAFALMARAQAARLWGTAARAGIMVDLLGAACRCTAGASIPATDRFEWVSVFTPDEVRDMVDEVLVAFRRADTGESDWDEFDALLHEWEESAWAIRNPALDEAMKSPSDEVPLTPAIADTEGGVSQEQPLTAPAEERSIPHEQRADSWTVVATNQRVNRAGEFLMAKAPRSAARCYEDLRSAPMMRRPGRVFPLRGRQYRGVWAYEVTAGDRLFYVPDPQRRRVVVHYAGGHVRTAPIPRGGVDCARTPGQCIAEATGTVNGDSCGGGYVTQSVTKGTGWWLASLYPIENLVVPPQLEMEKAFSQ